MKLMRIVFLFFFSVMFFKGSSLGTRIKTEPELSNVFLKSGQFRKLYEEGEALFAASSNRLYAIALELQRIAIQENKKELTFLANYFLARCHYFSNVGPKAIGVFETTLKIANKNKWHAAEIKINIYLGSVLSNKRSYDLSEKYFLKALELAKKYDRKDFLFDIYEKIGYGKSIRGTREHFLAARVYFKEGLKLAKEVKDTMQEGVFYARLGLAKVDLNDSSVSFIKRGISCLEQSNNTEKAEPLIMAWKSLGDTYYGIGKNDSSLYCYLQVYAIQRAKGSVRTTAISACDVAYMYGATNQINLMEQYADTAVMFAKRDKTGEARFYVYKWLADIYRKIGNLKAANVFYRAHSYLADSTLKSGNSESMASAGLQSDFESKVELMQLKEKQERERRQKEKDQAAFISKLYLYGFIVVGLFLIVILVSFVKNIKQKKIISVQHERVNIQKLSLEVKNKEITDSINYALRIQSALLPKPEELVKLLPGSFIYYKPKDIVSGDFYWFYKRDSVIFIACGDCTGHGVPGALMSVMGINLLTDIIEGNKASEPGKILELLRTGVIRSLNKDSEEGLYKDGMDISVVKIEESKGKFTYAGANNSVYKVCGTNLEEFKATKQPVGLSPKMEPFNQVEVTYTKGDHLVLFTDGFADQFGGKSNKKYMYKPFKEFLVKAIGEKANIEQKLHGEFMNWRANVEQVDDVCVIGLRL
jgi:serine phosphatase RsbU (regulator of sigma subunit)/tetratricopeptide (TPR) repeat protein